MEPLTHRRFLGGLTGSLTAMGAVFLVFTCAAMHASPGDMPPLKKLYLDTVLVANGVSQCRIAAPADAAIQGRLGPSADHPVALTFPEGDYLKGLVVRKPA
jgi:hypothetical protein